MSPDPIAEGGGQGSGARIIRSANEFPVRFENDGKSFDLLGHAVEQAFQILEEKSLLDRGPKDRRRSEEHTSELQSHLNLVCRLLLEKKNDASCALNREPA